MGKLGVAPIDHIWYGAGARQLNPFDADRLLDSISLLASSVLSLKNVTRTEFLLSYVNGASDFAAAGNRRGTR